MQTEASSRWQVGDVILNLYKISSVLGEGGFGTVYKVRHIGWNIDLALKVPKPEIVTAVGGVENFEREAETWINLGLHPHIVSCYYVRCIETNPLVFAEYVAGGSLHDWIRDRNLYQGGTELSLRRILDIAIQFAWGLHYAHEQRLIHQDVKPANVMLTPEGVAKVTDFGLANPQLVRSRGIASPTPSIPDQQSTEGSSGGATLQVTGSGAMTPAYCSPEQANREILTRRSDLWSWGLSVFEMFQGERTWPIGTIAAQVLESYLEAGPEDAQLPQMPEPVAQLLRRCFQQNPDHRPRQMLDVATQLREIYQQLTGEAYPRPQPSAAKDIADSLNNRAVSLLDLGRQPEALQLWEQALSAYPRHRESTYNRGLILWRSAFSNDDTLVRDLEQVRKSHPEDWLGDYLLSLVHLERDDCKAAIKALETIQGAAKHQAEVQTAYKQAQKRLPESKRLRHTFKGDTKRVNSVCISPDGQYAVSGKHDGTLELWELATGVCRTLEGHLGEGVKSVSITPDGRYAVSLSNLTLKLWELETGLCLCTFAGIGDWGLGIKNSSQPLVLTSPDRRYALSGENMRLTLSEVATGRELYSVERSGGLLCLTPDRRYALTVDGRPLLWEVATGRCVRAFDGHTRKVNSICISPDGRYALSGSSDHTVRLWEVATGECVRTFKGHTGEVKSVSISPDGRYALSGGHLTLKLWEVATGRCLRTFSEKDSINSVYISRDGHYALSGGSHLKLWTVSCSENPYLAPMVLCRVQATESIISGRQIYEQELAQARVSLERGDAVAAVQHLRKARLCFADTTRSQPGYSRDVEAFNAWTQLYSRLPRKAFIGGWEGASLIGHTSYVNAVVFSADSRFVLSGSSDNTLKLWEVATGRCLRTLEGYFQGTVNAVCLSADGRYALSGSHEGPLKLWEITTGRCLHTFAGDTAGTPAIALSPDGRYVLSGGHQGSVQLWEVSTGRCLRTFEGHQSGVNSVCFSPDGRYVLAGGGEVASSRESSTQPFSINSEDNTLKLWSVATGRCIRTFAEHSSGVNSVCMSPDGRYALSGSSDSTLKLWDVATGRCLRTFEGHQDQVTSVCISPDGRYAVSGSWDNTVKLWDVATGQCLHTFLGHTSVVKSVCFSLDGRYALSGSHDGSCKLWVLDWELDEQPLADWDEGARVYLETFLTLHTPYAAILPAPLIAPQSQPNQQQEQARRIYGFLLLLFGFSLAGTVILSVNAIAAGITALFAGAWFGRQTGWAGLKIISLFGVVALAILAVMLVLLPSIGSIFAYAALDGLSGALSAVLAAIAGVIIGAVFKTIRSDLIPITGVRRTVVVIPGAAAVTALKTEFGTILAIAILILVAALGVSFGLGFKVGFLNLSFIFLVLAIGLPLAWIVTPKSGSSIRWKALVKVGIAIIAIVTVLNSFKWTLINSLGFTSIDICEDITQTRNYLNEGGNPNALVDDTEDSKVPLLHCALMAHKTDVAKLLIENGADINSKISLGNLGEPSDSANNMSPLHSAAERGFKDVVELLIAKGADINIRNSPGETPLHLAVRNGKKDVVELLIAKGADVNAQSNYSRTPLQEAVDRNNTEIIELLKSHGATQLKVMKLSTQR